jgi:hypothetical protein
MHVGIHLLVRLEISLRAAGRRANLEKDHTGEKEKAGAAV